MISPYSPEFTKHMQYVYAFYAMFTISDKLKNQSGNSPSPKKSISCVEVYEKEMVEKLKVKKKKCSMLTC